ncbi:MAG: hypothetical protein AAFY38_14820 [Pseudomonadota bacterium]
MSDVMYLQPHEAVHVDHDKVGALYAQLGNASAEDVVCRAMEELALRMSQCGQLYRTGALDDLRKQARSLVAIADQIGMIALARVAADVTTCIDRHDQVALAATLSRLMRIGEGSLTAVWDLQDITI